MPPPTSKKSRDGKAATHGSPPADGSGRDLLGRIRALAENVRHQLAARRQNLARLGRPRRGGDR